MTPDQIGMILRNYLSGGGNLSQLLGQSPDPGSREGRDYRPITDNWGRSREGQDYNPVVLLPDGTFGPRPISGRSREGQDYNPVVLLPDGTFGPRPIPGRSREGQDYNPAPAPPNDGGLGGGSGIGPPRPSIQISPTLSRGGQDDQLSQKQIGMPNPNSRPRFWWWGPQARSQGDDSWARSTPVNSRPPVNPNNRYMAMPNGSFQRGPGLMNTLLGRR